MSNMQDDYNKLTEKQKRFISYYIETANATESALKAGYSKKTAYAIGGENLKKLEKFIKEKLEAKEDERIAKEDEVLRYLTSVMRGESVSEVVVVEAIGDYCSEARTMEKTPDEKERLKAAELLGKRYGAFIEKQEITTNTIKVELVDD